MQAPIRKLTTLLMLCVIVIQSQTFAQNNANQAAIDEANKYFQAQDWANAAKA